MLPSSTLVLGGAASGKSAFAESLCEQSGLDMVYLATARVHDAEMERKINLHKSRRDARWALVEAPLDLAPALAALTSENVVLIDCATMWLSNQMMADSDLETAQDGLLSALDACPAHWVMVSNEVGHGIVPDNAMARRFREAQGRLNIALASTAQTAVLVTAGLPQVLKGALS